MTKKRKKSTKKAALAGQPNWFKNKVLHGIILFALGFLLYANTLGHEYTQDDAIVIYDNEFTTKGFAGIPDILAYDTFRGFFKTENKDKLVSGGRYRPFTLLMFAAEWEIFGNNPFIGHLINALLYGLTGLLIYWLFQMMLKTNKQAGYATFIALVTAFLYITHPIHTEAVANIKGRDEIMTFLGSILALYFSFTGYRYQKTYYHFLAGIVFLIALFSKENAITFLAVTPLAFYVFTRASADKILIYTLPYIIGAAIFLSVRGLILGWDFGGTPMELMNNPFLKIVDNRYVELALGEKLATILYTWGKYLVLLVFPHPLTHDYYPRHIDIMSFGNPWVLLSALAYIVMGVYALIRLPKRDHIAFGILFYLLTFSIVSNLVFPIGTNMSERFLYMPSLGFCLVIAILLYRLAARNEQIKSFRSLQLSLIIVGIVGLLLAGKTVIRNAVWKDNFTLFTTDVNVSKNSAKLQNSVGGELTTQAAKIKDENQRNSMLREAVVHLKEAIRIHPTYKNAYLILGNAHNYLQEYETAIQYYQQALKLDANYPEALKNLAVTYRQAGRYYGEERGELNKALNYLNLAFEQQPNDYETVRLLGVAHGVSGDTAKAISYFKKAVELAPDNADAWWNLGSAHINAGQQTEANEAFKKAVSIDPEIAQKRGVDLNQ